MLSDKNPKPLCMSQLLSRVSLVIVTHIHGREKLVVMLVGSMAKHELIWYSPSIRLVTRQILPVRIS